MKCDKCGISVFNIPLRRVSSFTTPPVWWCQNCIKKYEFELYKNLKEEEKENGTDKIIKILNYLKK